MPKGLFNQIFFTAFLLEAILIGAASAYLYTLDPKYLLVSLVVVAWTSVRIKRHYRFLGLIIYLSILVLCFGIVKIVLVQGSVF